MYTFETTKNDCKETVIRTTKSNAMPKNMIKKEEEKRRKETEEVRSDEQEDN